MSSESSEIFKKTYSSTARVTKDDAETIDRFVELGYYPSRSRFVFESIRDIYMRLRCDLAVLYPAVKEKCSTFAQLNDAVSETVKKIYLEKSGYRERKVEKPTIVVSVTGNYLFMQYAIEKISDSLTFRDFQEVVAYCIFMKIKDLNDYMEKDVIATATENSIVDERRRIPTAEEISKILGDLGYE